MIGENPQLVIDEPVEFEKEPVEVLQITDHFKGIYKIYHDLTKEKPKGCQHVGLANPRISTD
jgi:hypothetical protein